MRKIYNVGFFGGVSFTVGNKKLYKETEESQFIERHTESFDFSKLPDVKEELENLANRQDDLTDEELHDRLCRIWDDAEEWHNLYEFGMKCVYHMY